MDDEDYDRQESYETDRLEEQVRRERTQDEEDMISDDLYAVEDDRMQEDDFSDYDHEFGAEDE